MITGKGIRYAFLYDYILKARKNTKKHAQFHSSSRKGFHIYG